MVRTALIVAIVGAYFFIGVPEYLSSGGVEAALSYPLFHGNVWHLSVNIIAVWSIYSPRYGCKPCRDLLIPYIISCLVYPLSSRPLLGISNIIYSVLGIRTPILSSRWWRQPPVIVFLAVTVLMLAIPQFAGFTHIVSFLAGVLLASVRRFWLKLTRDARRYY